MSQQPHSSVPTWDLSDRMSKALRHAGVPVQGMAEYLGVSRNTVGNYLHGRTVPDKRTMRLWAIRCGVPLEWLETGVVTEGDGPPEPPTRLRPDTQRYSDSLARRVA